MNGIELWLLRRNARLPYDPRRGGHAPSDLRRAFDDWVEEGMRAGMVGAKLFAAGPGPRRSAGRADWTTLTSTPEAGSPATKVGPGKVPSSMIDKRSEVLGWPRHS